MTKAFSAEEERALQESLSLDHPPECPRCGGPMNLTDVPPRSEVAYVRSRVLLHCRRCHLKCVVDQARGP